MIVTRIGGNTVIHSSSRFTYRVFNLERSSWVNDINDPNSGDKFIVIEGGSNSTFYSPPLIENAIPYKSFPTILI